MFYTSATIVQPFLYVCLLEAQSLAYGTCYNCDLIHAGSADAGQGFTLRKMMSASHHHGRSPAMFSGCATKTRALAIPVAHCEALHNSHARKMHTSSVGIALKHACFRYLQQHHATAGQIFISPADTCMPQAADWAELAMPMVKLIDQAFSFLSPAHDCLC